MSAKPFPVLPLSYVTLRVLIILNMIMGVLIASLLVASLTAEAWVFTALGVPGAGPERIAAMRAVMVIGIAGVPLTHVLLTRLLAIVRTVQAGDPFVADNARRLQVIAWALLGLELLHLAVGAAEKLASVPGDRLDTAWSFSPAGPLAVLLLFVLARVFDHGARLRDDLAGTV